MSFAQPFTNYEILDRIGSGAMGTVFKARQKHMNRIVALKVLKPSLARDKRYVERLRREARIVGKLNHPNIVTGYDLGEEGGYHFFVMELVEGRSLRQLLQEWGQFPEDQVLDVAMQIARALTHAFECGVIHRDIKPANVLIDDVGHVKLTDMGLAKASTDLTLTRDGATVGTPQYISPEQARSPLAVDVRSDLYSLGATLFHMATGQPPFRAETIGELIAKVLHDRPPSAATLNPDLSDGLSLVIRKLLAKDPALRYQTPAELLGDLERVRSRERPQVDPRRLEQDAAPAPGAAGVRWARWSALGLAVTAALIVAAMFLRGGDDREDAADATFRREVASRVAEAGTAKAALAVLDRFRDEVNRASPPYPRRLAVIDGERAAVLESLGRELNRFFDEFSGQRRVASATFLAEPGDWSDRDRFLREVVEPELVERFGYGSEEIPDRELRAAVRERLLRLNLEMDPLREQRDAAYVASFQRHLDLDLAAAVRQALDGMHFAAARQAVQTGVEGYHGVDGRPEYRHLPASLREQIDRIGRAERDALTAEIAVAQGRAMRELLDAVEPMLATASGAAERLARDGGPPTALRAHLDGIDRFLRTQPAAEDFAGGDEDPWEGIRSARDALIEQLVSLETAHELHLVDQLIAVAHNAFHDHGPGDAARVLGAWRASTPVAGECQRRHLRAFENAAGFCTRLSEALLDGGNPRTTIERRDRGQRASIVRDHDGVVSLVDDTGEQLPWREVDWAGAAVDDAVPSAFRAAVREDAGLRAGWAFWRLVDDKPVLAERLLDDDEAEAAFYIGELWSALKAARVDAVEPARAEDALRKLLRAWDLRDLESVRRARETLESFPDAGSVRARYGDLLGEIDAWIATEVRFAERSAAVLKIVPAGFDVRPAGDEVIVVSARLGALESLPVPDGWRREGDALEFDVGPLDLDHARALSLAIAFPFRSSTVVAATFEIRLEPDAHLPQVIGLELCGASIVIAVVPSGGLAAVVLPELRTWSDSGAVRDAIAGSVRALGVLGTPGPDPHAAGTPSVVPGAWHRIRLVLDPGRGGNGVVTATLEDERIQLCTGRAAFEPDGASVRLIPFQAVAVRRWEMSGRVTR